MPEKKKKKKKKATAKTASPEQLRFLQLLPQLKELEQTCRGKFQSISGFQVARSTSEQTSLTDLLHELEALECEVAGLLDGFEQPDIADIAVRVAQLLDAGSHDFFAGTRRGQGKLVMNAARRAICGGKGGGSPGDEEDDDEGEDDISDVQSDVPGSQAEDDEGSASPPKEQREQSESAAEQLRVENLVSAFASAGYLALCMQLWAPARDGDHETLERLLALDPWTVDEPGRQGQGCTNALQVACAAGHVQCVELLLKAGAIFRDCDWQHPTPHPFVCTSMLTGGGYFDAMGAPRGILHFQPSSFPRRRIARETYVHICDLLLEQATFCEGNADRDMLTQTRFALLSVEPPPLPLGVIACPPYVPPPKPVPAPVAAPADAPGQHTARARGGVAAATPRNNTGGVASATPRSSFAHSMAAALPRSSLTKLDLRMIDFGGKAKATLTAAAKAKGCKLYV